MTYRFRVLCFGSLLSRHRTRALAKRAVDRRVSALRRKVAAGYYCTSAVSFDYEVRLGKRRLYARGGWA